MLRLENLLKALTEVIVEYHQKKSVSSNEEYSIDFTTHSITSTDKITVETTDVENPQELVDEYVEVGVILPEKKTYDLTLLIKEITAKDSKRSTLFQYIAHIIESLKQIINHPHQSNSESFEPHEALLVDFTTNVQRLLTTCFPNTVQVNYNHSSIVIGGLVNEFQNGGGVCTSGNLLQKALFSVLFPVLFSEEKTTYSSLFSEVKACSTLFTKMTSYQISNINERDIKQAIRDLFLEYQSEFIKQENQYLKTANQKLQGKITQLSQQITLSPPPRKTVTSPPEKPSKLGVFSFLYSLNSSKSENESPDNFVSTTRVTQYEDSDEEEEEEVNTTYFADVLGSSF